MTSSANKDVFPEFKNRIKDIYAEYSAAFQEAVNKAKAAIYIRSSTDGIGGLESQLHLALSHAVKEGLSVPSEQIYCDHATGNQDFRPGLQTLQQLLDRGAI